MQSINQFHNTEFHSECLGNYEIELINSQFR